MNTDDRDSTEWADNILRQENRYCQDVTVTRVRGECPCGHRVGDRFMITCLDAGGLCGSLYTAIMPSVVTLHYGGSVLWEPTEGAFDGRCHEKGRVAVAVQRVDNPARALHKTTHPFRDMTGRGYAGLDRYRVMVEVIDIAGNCFYGHGIGDRFEIDPFNVNGTCGLLYNQLYPYMHVLLSGATPPWATQPHSIAGECPDIFNRLSFRMTIEPRQ
jgi:uncharacterized repeat protein (TIGR04076 family)